MTEVIIVGSAMLFVSVIIGLLMKKNIDLSVEKRSLIEEKKRRDVDAEILEKQRDAKPIRSHDDVDDWVQKHTDD